MDRLLPSTETFAGQYYFVRIFPAHRKAKQSPCQFTHGQTHKDKNRLKARRQITCNYTHIYLIIFVDIDIDK